jgi:hypothetical protein
MSKLHLILAFHNHQPVGNFDHVLENCYRKSYLPFLETLLDHSDLKVVLHYSGFLLTWIEKRHPEAIEIIRTLVASGRTEILSGGFYEPVLSVLPEKDRVLQITEFSRFARKTLGYTPKGLWLAERVWEPQMPKSIVKAGMEYLPIDDYHFKLTGLEEGDLLGYYITEDEGYSVSVFPGSERLRYLIPFKTIDEILSYFRQIYMRGGNPLLTMADDGEKFGVWPDTYKHCYVDRWLDNFLTAIEKNSDWIETTTFREYHERFQPLGRVYLPTASYREMGEWTLPAEAGLEYEYILEELKRVTGEKANQLVRGGIWRSFMVKYAESNHIHKRMFMISAKVHDAIRKSKGGTSSKRSGPKEGRKVRSATRDMLQELWKGQCNDAYWHGIFGGLYLPHLRSALYRHLLRAESSADEARRGYPYAQRSDFDCDGFDDIVINTRHLAVVASERSGSLTELSLYRQSVNMLDILARRPEAYHAKIAKVPGSESDSGKTIHDRLEVKEAGLAEYLLYDHYRRSSLLDRFLPLHTTVGDVMRSEYEELGDFIGARYEMGYSPGGEGVLTLSREGSVRQQKVVIEKEIALGRKSGLRVDYRLEGTFTGLFGVEMNISFLGSPHALIRLGGKTLTMRNTGTHEGIREFCLVDKFLSLTVDFNFSETMNLWHYPVETISLSEGGIERLYQGTSFLLLTNIDLRGKKKMWFTMNFREDTG